MKRPEYENPINWKQFKAMMKKYGVTDTSVVYGKLKFERKDGLIYTAEVPKPKKKKL